MIDRLFPDALDLSAGRKFEPAKNCPLKCGGDVLRLISPRDPLVKVAEYNDGMRVLR